MADVNGLIRDPTFQALPFNQRRQLLSEADPDFAQAAPNHQIQLLNEMKQQDWWQGGASKTAAAPAADNKFKFNRKVYQDAQGNYTALPTSLANAGERIGEGFRTAGNTIARAPGDLWDVAKGIYSAVRHPVQTMEGVQSLTMGALQKGLKSVGLPENYANALNPGATLYRMAQGRPILSGQDEELFNKAIKTPIKNAYNLATTNPTEAMAQAGEYMVNNPVKTALNISAGAGTLGKGAELAGLGRTASTLKGISTAFATPATAPLELAGAAGKAGLSKVLAPYANRVTPEMQSIMDLAAERGVTLTPADITKSRPLSLFENMLANIPTSSGKMQGFREGQLADYTNNVIKPLLEEMGAGGKTFSEVGKLAQDTASGRSKVLDALVSRKFAKAESLYPKAAVTTIDESAPWRPSSFTQPGDIPTTNTQNIVKKIMQEEADVLQPLKDTEALSVLGELANTDAMSFRGVQKNLSRMKDIIRQNDKGLASGSKFQSNSTAGALKRIVSTLESDVDNFAAQHGGAFEAAWHDARNTARAGYELFDSKRVRQVMGTDPGQLVNHFRPRNADALNTIKAAVGPRSFDQLRGAWLESIIKESPGSLGNALDKMDKGTLQAIFRPDELQEIQKMGKLGQTLRGSEKVAGNPSGTAQSLISPTYYTSIASMVVSGHAPAAIASVVTPPVLARLYLSKAGRTWLSKGMRIQPGTPAANNWMKSIPYTATASQGINNLNEQGNQ